MKKDVMIALDCASSEFYKDGYYDYSIFEKNNSTKLNSDEQVDFLVELCKNIQSFQLRMEWMKMIGTVGSF